MMKNNAQFSEKNLKRLIERFRANYLDTLHFQAGEGGPFKIDDAHNLWRGDTHLGGLKIKGERIAYDPPVEQASGPDHPPTEADIRRWVLAAWDKASSAHAIG